MPASSAHTVLGLYGSPRRGGNTDLLLDAFLRGTEEAGAHVERLRIARLKMGGCLGCGGCTDTGRCVVQDEMQTVYPMLDGSDRIVLASPIYFYNVTAQAKALIDRTQALWARKYLVGDGKGTAATGKAGRKGFLISVGATKGKRMFEGVRLTVRYFYDALDVQDGGEIVHWGVDEKGEIRKRAKALEDAHAEGLRFVNGA